MVSSWLLVAGDDARRRAALNHLARTGRLCRLFPGVYLHPDVATTLRENLRFARWSATDLELTEALAAAGLGSQWLAELAEGLDKRLVRHRQLVIAAPVEDGGPRGVGELRGLTRERGLTDARLSRQQHRAWAVTGQGRLEIGGDELLLFRAAHETGGVPSRAAAYFGLFQQDQIAPAQFRKMIGHATADNAAADDDHPRSGRK